ncbi:MAG: hypothetical protein LKI42_04570 [Bacteroidales bacterium]|jgi:hypothetical protein|nr:hypothetical protein [Bacteroidales bacterium]MCI1785606.1 hypothetical protein [Bacteroidales bacterium]
MKKVIYSVIGAMILCSAISVFFISGKSQKDSLIDTNIEALAYDEMPGEAETCERGGAFCAYHYGDVNYHIEEERNK